ncbi:MAG TPA: HypC/HybG/HupF family hydrogenase formation chaperone [Candidatus Deferrimicrobiaceae bacterium]|jgi:hydrogenase expression/formation protein HypC
MCLAIPAQILTLEETRAVVSIGGVTREASVMLLDSAAVGDWVLLHAGFAIEKLDPDEAEKTLALIREMADADPAR